MPALWRYNVEPSACSPGRGDTEEGGIYILSPYEAGGLPALQGDEVLEQLRKDARTAGVPVVVINADAMPAQIARLLAAGTRTYLTKPIDVSAMLDLPDTEFKHTDVGRN